MESRPQPYECLILVCTNLKEDGRACCAARGSEEIRVALAGAVDACGLKGRVRVSRTGCLGRCSEGPNVMVFPEGAWYAGVSHGGLSEIIGRHVSPCAEAPPQDSARGAPPPAATLRTEEPAQPEDRS